MSATAWPFIEVDEAGSPTIPTKGLKVLQLVREHLAYGWNAEQLRRQHLHLSRRSTWCGYYYENRAECDEMLHRDDQRLETLKDQLVNPALQERLRARLRPGMSVAFYFDHNMQVAVWK